MATTSSIGTAGRTYSTITSWLAAFAAGGWIGECYNDSEFTTTAQITFSGHAVSAANFITLTTAAGQSFQDNANVQTNALRYDVSKGVGIRKTNNYNNIIQVSESFVTLSKLQFSAIGTNAGGGGNNTVGLSGFLTDSCIVEIGAGNGVWVTRNGASVNCLFVLRATGANGVGVDYADGNPSYANCTVVRPSGFTAGGNAFQASGNAFTLKNCAGFGFSNFSSGGSPSGSNNCSDVAIGFGTSNQASKTYANQFQNINDATQDFRAKTGADLLNNAANVSASYTGTSLGSSLDIAKTTRPQGAAWDIGPWELVVSGGGITASAAWTETQDAWTGSVTLTFPTITANAAWTESRDLWAVTGSVKIDGAAAWTEARDAWAGSATISAAGIVAAGAWIETQDIWAGVATVALPAITANGAWVERQDIWNGSGGPPQILLGDAGDPGLRKRLKKIEQQRQKDFEREREQRERRKREVIAAFDRAIEGKPQISQAVAEDIVAAIEAEEGASPTFDFEAALNNVNRLQKLWDEHIERDDEEVLALL